MGSAQVEKTREDAVAGMPQAGEGDIDLLGVRDLLAVFESGLADGATGAGKGSDLTKSKDAPGVAPTAEGSMGPAPLRSGGQYLSLGHTVAKHVRLILVTSLVGLVIGAAFGLLRAPNYHAQARLVVGTNATLANVAAAAGLPAAEDAFAAEYARLLSDGSVQQSIASRLGMKRVIGLVTASPIPQSPVIQVDATASTSANAVALAEAGAQALLAEVYRLNNATAGTVQGLVSQYQQAEQAIAKDQNTVRVLQNQINALPASASSTIGTLDSQLASVQADIDAQQLKANALSAQYQNVYSPLQQEEDTVQISSAAAPSGSDRKSFLEMGVLAGLLAGAVIGLGIAAVRDLRRQKLPAPAPAEPVRV
ncbi:MAG: hypothetical protein ACYDEN_00615 [Acidimicrobiales bacterium]